ncbi:hypothetical protein OAT68_02515, partial [Flavobacteriaceae bacterium]|nr:hypothetical protein [Flavobacteriaceae bacterium]
LPDSSSVLLGTGSHTLVFSSTAALQDYKKLSIYGWQGTYGATSDEGPSTATAGKLKFSAMELGYKIDQLRFYNDSNTEYYGLQLDDGTYEVVPGLSVADNLKGHSNIIITGSATSGGSWSDSAPWVFTPSSDNANLLYTELRDKLNSGSVTISSANVSGTQGGSVILDWGTVELSSKNTSISSRTFTVNAAGSITQNSPINLYTDYNNRDGITMYPSIDLFYNSGEAIALNHYITTTPGRANLSLNGYGAADGGAVSFNASTTITLGGDSSITTTGAKQDYNRSNYNYYAGDGGDISLVAGTSVTIGSGRTITANGGWNDGGNTYDSSTESPYRRAGNGGNITIDAQTTVSIAGNIYAQGGDNNSGNYTQFYGGYGGDLTVNAPGGFSLSSQINLYAGKGYYYSSNSINNDRGKYRYTTPGDFTLSTDYSAVTSGGVNDGQTSGNIYAGSLTKNGSGKFKLLNHLYGGWTGNTTQDTNKYTRSLTINSGGILFGDTTALDDYTDITMTSSSTVLDLGGSSETVGSIDGQGSITSSSGGNLILTLSYNSNTSTDFSGTIEEGSATSLALYKKGSNDAVATLSGSNTYIGNTTINQGILRVTHNNALGPDTGGSVIVNNLASLQVSGTITVSKTTTLRGSGRGAKGALRSMSGDNLYQGSISILQSSTYINSDSGSFTLNGAVNLNTSSLYIHGDSSATGDITINGVISSTNTSGVLYKYVPGTSLTLTASNTYTGYTYLEQGILELQNGDALGSTTRGIYVRNGASLHLSNNISVGTEPIELKGTGVGGLGALRNLSGNNSWAGTIVTSSNDVNIFSDAGELTLSGQLTLNRKTSIGGTSSITTTGLIAGSQALHKEGSGTYTISGARANGITYISSGTLALGADNVMPDSSAVYFDGGDIITNNYSDAMGQLNLNESFKISLGSSSGSSAQHTISFSSAEASFTSGKEIEIIGWEGGFGAEAVTRFGESTSSSSEFVSNLGSLSNTRPGSVTKYGEILSGPENWQGDAGRLFIYGSLLDSSQISQIKFKKADLYYNALQTSSKEIVPNDPG